MVTVGKTFSFLINKAGEGNRFLTQEIFFLDREKKSTLPKNCQVISVSNL